MLSVTLPLLNGHAWPHQAFAKLSNFILHHTHHCSCSLTSTTHSTYLMSNPPTPFITPLRITISLVPTNPFHPSSLIHHTLHQTHHYTLTLNRIHMPNYQLPLLISHSCTQELCIHVCLSTPRTLHTHLPYTTYSSYPSPLHHIPFIPISLTTPLNPLLSLSLHPSIPIISTVKPISQVNLLHVQHLRANPPFGHP